MAVKSLVILILSEPEIVVVVVVVVVVVILKSLLCKKQHENLTRHLTQLFDQFNVKIRVARKLKNFGTLLGKTHLKR